MYYVTMTDNFMSGWGRAKDRINKLVFECESHEEAEIVAENARRRNEMKYVNIVKNKPSYSSKKYFVSHGNKESHPAWYKEGSFKA